MLRDYSARSTRLVLRWWARPHDLLNAIDEYIGAGEDPNGEPRWNIELDDEAADLLADARSRAPL